MVIPGKHMLPPGMENPHALDEIRQKNEAWITATASNIFEIRTRDIRQLQEAVKDIHWALHDMRLSGEKLAIRFLAQKPFHAQNDAGIRVELNSRPHFATTQGSLGEIAPVVLDTFEKLQANIAPSAAVLGTMTTELKMRLNFGRFEVRQRKRCTNDEMSFLDFARMVPQYSVRGGASMHTRLVDVERAPEVVRHLLDPAVGCLYPDLNTIKQQCTVVLKTRHGKLVATASNPSLHQTQLSAAI
ncbi:hypothetical protein CDD83_10451 [Cordyceps sp. RAO-2017]|nr:hypothetical protein CDD83_10451 [Cordyceps sp. RAO-2017]